MDLSWLQSSTGKKIEGKPVVGAMHQDLPNCFGNTWYMRERTNCRRSFPFSFKMVAKDCMGKKK